MLNWKKETIALLFLLAIAFWPSVKPGTTQAQHPPPQQSGVGVSIIIEGAGPPPPPPPGQPPTGGGVTIIPIPANVIFKGFAYPKALVTFVKNGAVIGNALADNNGSFIKEISTDAGISTFGIWARDQLGLNSQTTNVTISLAENTRTTISNIILSPTIAASKSIATQGEQIVIFGSATPKSTVRIFNNYSPGQTLPPLKAGDNGHWEYTLSTLDLEPGEYSVKAITQLDALGLISAFSNNLIFNIEEKECYESDLNNDGLVNINDFSIMMFYWNRPLAQIKDKPVNGCADADGDGYIGLVDFSIMMYRWTG